MKFLAFLCLLFGLILQVNSYRFQEGIYKYNNSTTILGTDPSNPMGDGLPASLAQIYGNLLAYNTDTREMFIADAKAYVVRRIDAQGNINRFVGGYKSGFSGDGGLAINALISTPNCLVLFNHSLYICDSENHVIRKVDSDGIISTVIGIPGNCSVSANDSLLCKPSGLAFSEDGSTMYIADGGSRVKRITNNTVTIIAGQFSKTGLTSNIDGAKALFQLPSASPLVYDGLLGGLFLLDMSRIHFINLTNNYVSIFAQGSLVTVLVDSDNIYTVFTTLIKKKDKNTSIETTIAGPGLTGYIGTNSTMVKLTKIASALLIDGQIYFVDFGVLKLFNMKNSTITTIAGCCSQIFSTYNVFANTTAGTGKRFVVDTQENVYLPDPNTGVFKKIEKATGLVSVLAGIHGISTTNAQGGVLASQMIFNSPSAIMINNTSIFLGDKTKVFLLDTNTNLVTQYSSQLFSGISDIFYDPKFDSIFVFDANTFILNRIYKNGTSEAIYTSPSSNIYFVKETYSLYVAASPMLKINLNNMDTETYGGKIGSYISEIDVRANPFPSVTCLHVTPSEIVYLCTSFGIVKLENSLKISTILPSVVNGVYLYVNNQEDLFILTQRTVLIQYQTFINLFRKGSECSEGFYGEYCNVTLCNGKFSNHSKSCSGFGYCSSKGICNCDLYYYGNDCQRKYVSCDTDISADAFDTSFCNGRGLCRPGRNCLCLSNNLTDVGPTKSIMRYSSANQITGVLMTSEDKSCSLIQETYRWVYKCGDIVTWIVKSTGDLDTTKHFYSMYFRFRTVAGGEYAIYPFGTNTNEVARNNYLYLLAGNDGSLRRIDTVGSVLYFSNTSLPGKVENNYGGADCSNSDCFGYYREEPIVCSGHGTCLGYNNCSCFHGYHGADCSIYSCYNISSTNSSVCSGKGECSEFDTCECNLPFFGPDCSEFTCNGKNSKDATVCSSNGICVSPDVCVCNAGYFGENCETTSCFGLFSNSSFVCGGHGSCVGYNTCNCKIGYGPSNDCEYPICGGFLSNDTRVCNNSLGVCVGPNECKSLDIACYGKPQNNSLVCSGQGSCIDWDHCECKTGFTGNECQNLSMINNTSNATQHSNVTNFNTTMSNETIISNATVLNNETVISNMTVINNNTMQVM